MREKSLWLQIPERADIKQDYAENEKLAFVEKALRPRVCYVRVGTLGQKNKKNIWEKPGRNQWSNNKNT